MSSDYFRVMLSVDALVWTRHWLGEGNRCDLLVVDIARNETVEPQFRFTAVESKATTDTNPIACTETAGPFPKALTQVVSTLNAIEEALRGNGDLITDLKRTALLKFIITEALSKLAQKEDKDATFIVATLNALSKRATKSEDIALEGLVVVTQRQATVKDEVREIERESEVGDKDFKIRLIRCGLPRLRKILQANATEEDIEQWYLDRTKPLSRRPDPEPKQGSTVVARHRAEDEKEADDDKISRPAENAETEAVADGVRTTDPIVLSDATRQLIGSLEEACRLRNFPIRDVDHAQVKEGPTLISVPVGYKAGAELRPVQQATTDIARDINVPSITVENDPEHPGSIRFLLPRKNRVFPPCPDADPKWYDEDGKRYLGIWLGAKVDGTPYRSYVSEWPHLLIAGTTGSGKTMFMKTVLSQLNKCPDNDLMISVIDGKGEYDYDGLVDDTRFPKKFPELLLGHENANPVLEWIVEEEIPRRRTALRNYMHDNPDAPRQAKQAYVRDKNQQPAGKSTDFPVSPLVVVIDEFAEIMMASAEARVFQDLVQRIVQKGRSTLVHLLLATQRPDANVVPGTIKANLPSRVGLKLPSHHDSQTILNRPGAEKLLGAGDLIFSSQSGEYIRLQGFDPGK